MRCWRRLGRGTFTLAGSALLVATLISFTGTLWAFGELLSNLRLQLLVVSAILLFAALAMRSRGRAILILALCAANSMPVLPYINARPANAAENASTLSVMTLNLFYGQADPDRVARLVEDWSPDVVVLTEITPRTDTDYPPLFKDDYPFGVGTAGKNTFDLRVFSRFPLENVIVDREEEFVPILNMTVRSPDIAWRMIAVHAPPPMLGTAFRDRVLVSAAEKAKSAGGPSFLVGDLNVTPWSPSFAHMAEIGDLRDSALGHPLLNTWLFRTVPFGLPLDHVLTSKDVVTVQRRVSAKVGSDHLALFARLAARAP